MTASTPACGDAHESTTETLLLQAVLTYMSGSRTLAEAATAGGVPASVVTSLAAEYAAFMLPRAMRAVRVCREARAGD